jgi:hypothetical protein
METSQINWTFDKEILTNDNLKHAEAFWKHCLLAGYEELYNQQLLELKKSINNFKSRSYGDN